MIGKIFNPSESTLDFISKIYIILYMTKFYKNFFHKKFHYTILALILILGAYLRISGFSWGLPEKPYFRAGYQDEAFIINFILSMNPKDLNPHYFINPSFHYYTVLAGIKFGHIIGYIKNFAQPVATNLQGHPVEKITLNDYSKMYVIGRLITVIEGILTVLFIYLIGLKIYDKNIGLFASFIFAILPTVVFQSHFFVVDSPAVFWAMLAFSYMVSKIDQKEVKADYFIKTGILMGLALGTKYMNLLMVFPFLMLFLLKYRKLNWRYPILTILIMFFVFVLTTPHSILSFREFLFGSTPDGFGSIFGKKGLFAYNTYPANPVKTFLYGVYHPLRLPLTILFIITIACIIAKRNISDMVLLALLIPFYVILCISPSPHLRHTLPVMPFIALIIARGFSKLTGLIKQRFIHYGFIIYSVIAILYTLLFTMAMIDRMEYPDTRIECADWMFKNIPAKKKIATSTVMPFRYTPPVECPGYDGNKFGLTDEEVLNNLYYNLIKTNYDYYRLLYFAPDYFFITQIECVELPYNEVGEINARNFLRQLFAQKHYQLIKVFERKFNIFGIRFEPSFPNMDWNPVSHKIYLFKKKF